MKSAFHRQVIATVAIAVLLTVPALAQPPLLSSSDPGAFGVRYLPDRAVVTYTVERPAESDAETFTLRVRLPEAIQWGFLDREEIPGGDLGWDNGQAVVDVPFGSARLHLGWAGEANLPPESAQVPVFLGDRRVGSMTAHFDLEGMQASGEVPGVGPGSAEVRVEMNRPIPRQNLSLSTSSDAVERWRRDRLAYAAREPMQVGHTPRFSLRVDQRGLTESPVERVVFSEIQSPSQVVQVPEDARPDGILVEGQDFVDWTGTQPQVEPGRHFPVSGGAIVFSFIGDGTTIDWEVEIPETGLYDLYIRMACGDVGVWRSISIDGETPAGLDLVEFPGTGGWGYGAEEWQIVRVTGGEDQSAPLELDAGTHTVTMTGLLTTHMNIDYLLFVPHE